MIPGSSTPQANIDALWRACLERPGDDGTRGVLADQLQIAGDARGELMSLQLLPADPEVAPARRARIRELLGTYAPMWLGPLYELATGARFERGFVTRLELGQPAWAPHDARWELDDREAGAVEDVLRGSATSAIYHRVITNPRLVNLRRIAVPDHESIAALSETPARIEHVVCDVQGNDQLLARALAIIGERASVVSLAIWSESFVALQRQAWFERLTSLTIAGNMRRGLAWWPRVPPRASLVLAPTVALDSCERAFPMDAMLELRRDGVARVSGEWLLGSLDMLLELPREITRLEIEDTSEPIVDRIRRAVAPRGLEVGVRGLIGRAGNLRWGFRTTRD